MIEFRDPLYKARDLRDAAALIIRHCKTDGFDSATGIGRAYLRNEAFYEDAGAMLARRGFGTLAQAPGHCSWGGHTFTLRAALKKVGSNVGSERSLGIISDMLCQLG